LYEIPFKGWRKRGIQIRRTAARWIGDFNTYLTHIAGDCMDWSCVVKTYRFIQHLHVCKRTNFLRVVNMNNSAIKLYSSVFDTF